MDISASEYCTAFSAGRRIAVGRPVAVAVAIKAVLDSDAAASVLVFDDATSEVLEFDSRGTAADVAARVEAALPAAPVPEIDDVANRPRVKGRPKLGVVAREVTLLPRHWEWLGAQSGGASVALRKLVEEARRVNAGRERIRRSQEVTYRFMSAIGGDFAGYEEATRALFAADRRRFDASLEAWPAGVRAHASKLAAEAFTSSPAA